MLTDSHAQTEYTGILNTNQTARMHTRPHKRGGQERFEHLADAKFAGIDLDSALFVISKLNSWIHALVASS